MGSANTRAFIPLNARPLQVFAKSISGSRNESFLQASAWILVVTLHSLNLPDQYLRFSR